MKTLAVLAAIFMAMSPPALAENPSSTLRVSAVIPPQPCDADRSCEQPAKPLPAAATSVTIDGQQVQYVGSMPAITETENLKTVLH